MTLFDRLLGVLTSGGVEFIVIGGAAGTAHGSARFTRDLDIVYARSAENIARLVAALAPFSPYLRGAPPGLPFQWDTATVTAGLNFTLITSIGEIDLLGHVTGGPSYEDLLSATIEMTAFGVTCRYVTLEKLIGLKRAAGRPRDFEAIAELEALLEESQL
jgi:predicted nucleotidyltransferase